LPASEAAKVMEGARKTCTDAGIVIAGGHSIDSQDPIFGLVVNGLIEIENLKRNDTAKEGDVLILTKPLGVGIMATAQKRAVLTDEDLSFLVKQLTTINKAGAALGKIKNVHAMTDVTGFGLLGHLTEMMEGSNLSASIEYNRIPIIPAVRNYIAQKTIPGATARNWSSCSDGVVFGPGVDEAEATLLLPDPQTNGGLLIAVAPTALKEAQTILQAMGIEYFNTIGACTAAKEKRIYIN
jgi:selenide,water dikinase